MKHLRITIVGVLYCYVLAMLLTPVYAQTVEHYIMFSTRKAPKAKMYFDIEVEGPCYILWDNQEKEDLVPGKKVELKVKTQQFKIYGAISKFYAEECDLMSVDASGSPYLVANKGMTYTLGLSYTIPVKSKVLSAVQLYNEFGLLDKTSNQLENTIMDVLGVQLIAGNVYVLFDCAMGVNQPYFGGDWYTGLGAGKTDAKWETRFNINFGYYF